jgi:hypothetical protein
MPALHPERGLAKKVSYNIYAKNSGLARNRTWIWSFGNSYTIHCTTRPEKLAALSSVYY